jgi:beta-lactamase superfamily II metal-dependent hydrolase
MSLIQDNELVIHFLNVGHGDAIVIEFPTDDQGRRCLGIVDCYRGTKVRPYLTRINNERPFDEVAFVCATHPHYDHISGIRSLLNNQATRPLEFWDSGFRHQSATYRDILEAVVTHNIQMIRVSSGMEWYFGSVRVTALSPSMGLRNRYSTYGVDTNNASIVLRLENCSDNVVTIESLRYEGAEDPEKIRSAGAGVVILAGDAEFDSWGLIAEEYPCLTRTAEHRPLVTRMINLLNCELIKVPHHGSMHSAPLDIYERMTPAYAVISNQQRTGDITVGGVTRQRDKFPHNITKRALEEEVPDILTTDGSYETENGLANAHEGSIVVAIPPGGPVRIVKLTDSSGQTPHPPTDIPD